MKRLPIKGYEGSYEINEVGDVYSLARTVIGRDGVEYPFKERKLAFCINPQTGYKMYSLWGNNTGTSYAAHRLVALTFIPNNLNYPVVNHIDGDKLNNSVSNLEWCTHQQNATHAVSTGLKRYTNRLSRDEFLQCLDSVIAGESFAEVCERIPYQVPFLSTKLRKLAREEGIEDQLDMSIRLRRANKNREVCKTQREPINQFTLEGEFVKQHESLQAAARYLGKTSSGSISNAVNPTMSQNTAYGFKWEKCNSNV